ncbi:hypothetical protein CE206_28820 (plasmid) [Achromobacter xylosoxidans]|uniref:hypothetical protein n=1 Tax=Alcaligenes xylosoxydans xylosoxydans TaxID=85698 RepID=UPI000DD14B31|nr:hypothetical protein [Achromobacter xylosoxidans]AXA80583.1 hypothetical protein CE206_28820 [Achromobacter xylosoxidans]
MTLFEKLGLNTLARIDDLRRKQQIVAIHHEPAGTRLVLVGSTTVLLEGTSEEDSRRLVGYLGFHGCGKHGLDTPAFLVKPT